MPAMSTSRARKILVTMPTINRPERLKLDGILAYAHEKVGERWQIILDFGALSGAPAPLSSLRADGVIAYIDSSARRREIVAAKLPAVLIEDALSPRCGSRAKHGGNHSALSQLRLAADEKHGGDLRTE